MSSFHGQTAKSRTKVKPILRKLTQSERNSLDLDRPAEQQDGLGIYDFGTGPQSSHDIVYQNGRRGYHHRSTSGTSQFSTATTGSGQRSGSFVHPFQQTPRPYTPPLAASYQNSLRESEHSNLNSPALTEDEQDQMRHTLHSTSNLSNRTPSVTASSPNTTQPLRVQTKQLSSSRLALATSHTSLHNPSAFSPDVASPTDNMSPISLTNVRTSIDKGFRIRSRSEVDTRERPLTIEEHRRRFREKEAKEKEEADREEIRQIEKKNQKEARQRERGHRRSSASEGAKRSRSKSDLTMYADEKNSSDPNGFLGRDYNSVPEQDPPYGIVEEEFERPPRRSHTGTYSAKKKTHGAWTKLMMWLRTRFIRMGKKDRS